MRTIIINTMGSELPPNQLFFMPFRQDQLFWLERDLGGIGTCAEEIETICKDQDKHQDYQLVVLVNLVGYAKIEYRPVCEAYQELVRAYLNRRLLEPLTGTFPPRSVNLVYLLPQRAEGDGGVPVDQVVNEVFDLRVEDQPIRALRLKRVNRDGAMEQLELTGLFSEALTEHHASVETRVAEGKEAQSDSTLKRLRDVLQDQLEKQQSCTYTPLGRSQQVELLTQAHQMECRIDDLNLVWIALQLNLSEYLKKQQINPKLQEPLTLKHYSEEELAKRVTLANVRARYLQDTAPKQTYFPLEAPPMPVDGSLTGQIWEALTQQQDVLPAVREACACHAEPDAQRHEGIIQSAVEELHRTWLRVGRERKQFDRLCDRLEAEYNEQTAKEQQYKILDICAGQFHIWRSTVLSRPEAALEKPEEKVQPEYNVEDKEKALEQAQEEAVQISAEKLEDYLDVRQEAEVVKARFRKAARFWAPDSGSRNTKNFQIYSLVLVALFLVQMMLPYVGITMGQSGVELSRYVHFALSAALFVVLYFAGMLFWLRGLCKELHQYSQEMRLLILKSCKRRQASIQRVVEAYGDVMPRCTVLHEELRQLAEIHSMNQRRKVNYNAHMQFLRQTRELLLELETELQLPYVQLPGDPRTVTRGIRYDLPPGHSENIGYYLLLSEDWGDKK